jgi:hypothetical protein
VSKNVLLQNEVYRKVYKIEPFGLCHNVLQQLLLLLISQIITLLLYFQPKMKPTRGRPIIGLHYDGKFQALLATFKLT